MGELATGIGPPILLHPQCAHSRFTALRHRPIRPAAKLTAINTRVDRP
jgi:hypothetical protein